MRVIYLCWGLFRRGGQGQKAPVQGEEGERASLQTEQRWPGAAPRGAARGSRGVAAGGRSSAVVPGEGVASCLRLLPSGGN